MLELFYVRRKVRNRMGPSELVWVKPVVAVVGPDRVCNEGSLSAR